jgi:hypothetical protein
MSGALQAVFQNQRSFGAPAGQQEYTTAGTYTWVAPTAITSVSVVCVGGGGGGGNTDAAGGGGGLRYKNSITVTPGTSYTVVVGAGGTTGNGGQSYFNSTSEVYANGGSGSTGGTGIATGGSIGGGNGGNGNGSQGGGGGGAGGYSGNGGAGGAYFVNGSAGAGGGGGGGGGGEYATGCCCAQLTWTGAGGGGVAIQGQDTSGNAGLRAFGGTNSFGFGGSPNGSSIARGKFGNGAENGQTGSIYGGGGSARANGSAGVRGNGARGAVRIIWAGGSGITRSFPSTNTGDM